MGSKKKKYNSRFPPARIKKIMQVDEEIGKVAQSVPVIISKCVEMFLTEILKNAGKVTEARKAKTMSISHLKELVMKEENYDFLRDLVQNEEENIESGDAPKPKRKRSASSNKCKPTSAKKVKGERKSKKKSVDDCIADDVEDQASTSNQQNFEDPFPTSNMQQQQHVPYFPPSLQQPPLIAPPPPMSSMDDEDDDYDI